MKIIKTGFFVKLSRTTVLLGALFIGALGTPLTIICLTP